MRNWCHRCNGSGKIQDLSAKWWKFWKLTTCTACNGGGEILPHKKSKVIPDAPPSIHAYKLMALILNGRII